MPIFFNPDNNNFNDIEPISSLLDDNAKLASNAICKISNKSERGTGFLISPNLIMTNNHVIDSKDLASKVVFEKNFIAQNGQLILDNRASTTVNTEGSKFFYTNKELDFTIIALKQAVKSEFVVLQKNAFAATDACNIIHYPHNREKSITLRNNTLVNNIDERFKKDFAHKIWYITDTEDGSSGAPVFNNAWQIMALHHGYFPAFAKNSDGNAYFIKSDGKEILKSEYESLTKKQKNAVTFLNHNEAILMATLLNDMDTIGDRSTVFIEFKNIVNGQLPQGYTRRNGTSIAVPV